MFDLKKRASVEEPLAHDPYLEASGSGRRTEFLELDLYEDDTLHEQPKELIYEEVICPSTSLGGGIRSSWAYPQQLRTQLVNF
ncbi:hypothetical protein FRC14_002083 [Serendipita sp. 396]|nr:hypothetical protein FRC14_002083 [Serendipita sp. 396]KAG8777690.1 hypothetical protein FRC15_011175 [Serendipita sp. 397]KAG8817361.1 hypothetical protein FRC18_000575 [Serendipita sp. 400]KAG8818586.1 hypothetical protein FRC19_010553 [Serendipita sp. 401]KAG8862862.1 hypothetical protein FRC20_011008 [Serendipita sp. 405]KAG9044994.1 hypothetical protein FS842_001290 [Serendipita sp. 407]